MSAAASVTPDESFTAQLRRSAIEHASIPIDPASGRRPNSPLYKLIPDGEMVTDELADIVEEIIGRPLVDEGETRHIFAPSLRSIPARSRSRLTRWAMREFPELTRAAREDVRARELWRDLTGSSR